MKNLQKMGGIAALIGAATNLFAIVMRCVMLKGVAFWSTIWKAW